MQTLPKQPHLSMEQPDQPLNLCPCCAEKPKLYDNADGSFSLKCSCSQEVKLVMPKVNDIGIQLLCVLWNIETTQKEWSEKVQQQLGVSDGSLCLYDLRNYDFICSYLTFFDAIVAMEKRFSADLDQRTALFQMNKNSLDFVMISDELYEDLTQ